MLKQCEILDEKEKALHKISNEITFPISKEDKNLIKKSIEYLRLSQDEDYAEKNNIRGGMGLAFPQLGFLKRIFVISYLKDNGEFEEYSVINPKILSHSEELVYVEEGEGCLSVNRDVPGIVPRFARCTIEFYNENGEKQIVRAREEISVAFQHEIDHLNGILFVDRIDKKNPFKNKDKMRAL